MYNQRQDWVLFSIAALLVVYPLFFRGLYFPREMFVTHIISSAVFVGFWIIKWKRRDLRFIRTPLDWAVLAFAAAYALSLITAVLFGEALYGCIKAFNYFMLYWLVGQVITDYGGVERLTQVLLLAALGVGIIGILAASGFAVYPYAFDEGLINSTLQYHNATAAFLAAMSVLALSLLTRPNQWPAQLGLSVLVYFLQVIVFATVSKGAWLTLVLGGLFLVIGIPGWRRVKTVYFLGGLALVAFVTGNRFLIAALSPNPQYGLVYIMAGVAAAALVYMLWEAVIYLLKNHPKGKLLVGMGCILLLAALIYLLPNGTMGLPKYVLKELSEIGQSDNASYVTRLDFMRWGLSIVKDYPVFGAGAGGWDGLYHRYQDYLFWTKTVHNHFIQVWVEAGTIGLLAYAGIWLAMFGAIAAIYRNKSEQIRSGTARLLADNNWILAWGLAATAVTMGLHASIDFDFSLPALFIIWFTLMAMINALYIVTGKSTGYSFSGISAAVLSVLLGMLVFIIGGSALAGYQKAELARQLAMKAYDLTDTAEKRQAFAKAALHYQKAINASPWEGSYYSDLAMVYAEQYNLARASGEQDLDALYKNSLDAMVKADKLSPGNMVIQSRLLDAAALFNDFHLIMARLDRTTAANPLDIGNYEGRAKVLWRAVETAYKSDDDRVSEYCEAILQIPEMIEEQQARIKKNQVFWQGARLEVTPEIALNIARVYYLRGQYQEAIATAEPAYQMVLEQNQAMDSVTADLQAVYAASLRRQGDRLKAQEVLHSRPDDRAVYLYRDMMQWDELK
ncbi:MAG: O-antigen ligase family protein [Syntrophomonadaceae bacterium]|nr:O-antigen ligase family protein [Syntrophomonadaceae bacterium]